VLSVRRPSIMICFLEHAIEFKSHDNLPVHTLFWMVTPSVRSHTHMLARLASLLVDPGFKAVLARRGTTDEILSEARRIEASLGPVNGEAK
jgi:PTS system nitrogen regulatory IIA component